MILGYLLCYIILSCDLLRDRLTCPAKFMKAFVYILRNGKNEHYVGITALPPGIRLARHNKGDVYSTKLKRPWFLIYVEEWNSMSLARDRECQIKSWKGGNGFKKLIAKAARSSNGRTAPFEGVYLGSNPSLAALAESKKIGGVK